MKNKKILVVGIALILLAMVAAMSFAGELNGVVYAQTAGHTYLTNQNDYTVTVWLKNVDNGMERAIILSANASRDLEGTYTILDVKKGRY
jgi:ABC-type maltose transport system permease subunit